MVAGEGASEEQPEAAGSFPLADIPRDVLVACLGCLAAVDLACAGGTSRIFFLVAREVQRRPELVVEVGDPTVVLASLGNRLVATPTMGFLFGTEGSFDLGPALAQRLPAGCQVLGAVAPALQALAPATTLGGCHHAAMELHSVVGRRQVSLMLGSFPDAVARAFHVTTDFCSELSRAESVAAAARALTAHGLPTGDEWKTVVLVVAMTPGGPHIDPLRVLQAYQRSCPRAAIIGGMAGELLLHTLGKTRLMDSGVVGLALRGEVPLTALVSRGCAPLSPPLSARGARLIAGAEGGHRGRGQPDDEMLLTIPELSAGDGATLKPIEVVIQAQEKMDRRVGQLFSGVRLSSESGYVLEPIRQENFAQGGALSVPWDGGAAEAAPAHCEVRFFQLSADACRDDLKRLLGCVRAQCEERDEQVLGSVMFTCGGRGQRFFGEECGDAKRFCEAFPSAPLVGFWAGGEIGPQALAEATPAEATRTGSAALQGFTAVFGIFRVPKPSRGTSLAVLADERVPDEVGRLLACSSQEAKERGNAAFREGDVRDAVTHYTRAVDLAAVPSAQVPACQRAMLLANRALAQLKVGGGLDAARADAEAAVGLDPSNAKAHYRHAQALVGLERPQEAAAVLRSAVAQLPEEKALADYLAKVGRGLK